MGTFNLIQEMHNARVATKSKELIANEILEELIRRNPVASQLNAATLRDFVMRMMGFNELPSETYFPINRLPSSLCTSASVSVPIKDANVDITVTSYDEVLKVCPICFMTAKVEDPLCTNCDHVYVNCDLEAQVTAATVRKCNEEAEVTAGVRKGKGNIVLKDDVEGITITERDLNKYLPNIEKFIPTR